MGITRPRTLLWDLPWNVIKHWSREVWRRGGLEAGAIEEPSRKELFLEKDSGENQSSYTPQSGGQE